MKVRAKMLRWTMRNVVWVVIGVSLGTADLSAFRDWQWWAYFVALAIAIKMCVHGHYGMDRKLLRTKKENRRLQKEIMDVRKDNAYRVRLSKKALKICRELMEENEILSYSKPVK